MKTADIVLMQLIKKNIAQTSSIFLPNFHMYYLYHGIKWEADLFQLTKDDWAIEYEVKVSKADLKNDFNKAWWGNAKNAPKKHDFILNGELSNRFYFVIPEDFISDNKLMQIIPSKYGIITFNLNDKEIFKTYRQAKVLHKNKTIYRDFVVRTALSKYNFLYIKYINSQIKLTRSKQ